MNESKEKPRHECCHWPVTVAVIAGGIACFSYSVVAELDWKQILINSVVGALALGLVVLLCISIFPSGTTAKQINALQRNMPRIAAVMFVTISLVTTIAVWSQNQTRLIDIAVGALTGLVGAVVTVVGIQTYIFSDRMGSVEKNVADANRYIKGAVETLEADLVGTASATIAALEHTLNIGRIYETKMLADQAPKITAGLQAMGLTYEAWVRRFNKKEEEFAAKVWLAAFPTFHRETAFDINNGEIVTNSRNFCFLLLSTVSDLLEHNDGKTIVYHQVTPVHPKDWYNWPHGYNPHLYFENDFIGIYHRSLALLNKWAKAKSRPFEHTRYVLSLADNVIDPFGWDLPEQNEFSEPEKFQLLDFSVPLDAWPNVDGCDFANRLGDYYRAAAKCFSRDGVGARYAVPAWNNKWLILEDHLPRDIRDAKIKLAESNKCTKLSCDCAKQLRAVALSNAEEKITTCTNKIAERVGTLNNGQLTRVWKDLQERITKPIENGVPEFVRDYQLTSVHLSSDQEGATAIRGLLAAVLRKHAALNAKATWGNLYSTFAENLHPSASDAKRAILQEADLKGWAVEPEFAILGVRRDESTIDWKVVIATSLDYPFNVAQIRILGDPSRRAPYELIIGKLSTTISTQPLWATA